MLGDVVFSSLCSHIERSAQLAEFGAILWQVAGDDEAWCNEVRYIARRWSASPELKVCILVLWLLVFAIAHDAGRSWFDCRQPTFVHEQGYIVVHDGVPIAHQPLVDVVLIEERHIPESG